MARSEEEQTMVSRVGVPPPTRAVPSPEQKELIASGKASPTGLAIQQFPGLQQVQREGNLTRSREAAAARGEGARDFGNKSVYTDEYTSGLPPARAIANLPEEGSTEEKSINTYKAVADAVDNRYTDPERLGAYMKRVETAANYMMDLLSQNRDLLESQTYGYSGRLISRGGTGGALSGLMQMVVDADKEGNRFTKDVLEQVYGRTSEAEGVAAQKEIESGKIEGKVERNMFEKFLKLPKQSQEILLQKEGFDPLGGSPATEAMIDGAVRTYEALRGEFEPAIPDEGGEGEVKKGRDVGISGARASGSSLQFENPEDLYLAEARESQQGTYSDADLKTMDKNTFAEVFDTLSPKQVRIVSKAIRERETETPPTAVPAPERRGLGSYIPPEERDRFNNIFDALGGA